MSELLFSVVTDKGDVRRQNEDSVFAKTAVYNGHMIGMFAVADGCGGLDSGAEISALVTLRAAALFEKLVSGGQEVRADAIRDDFEPLFGAALANRLRNIMIEVLRPSAVGEFDAGEAHFRRLIDDAEDAELVYVVAKAVGCNRKFHFRSPYINI